MAHTPADFTLVSFSDLKNVPEPAMLIDGIIPTEGIIALSADPNRGKTFLMIEMARAIVTGAPFLGKFPTRKGSVLFIGQDASVFDYARQVRKVAGAEWQAIEDKLAVDRELHGNRDEFVNPFDDLLQYCLQPNFYMEDGPHVNALIEVVNGFAHSHVEKKEIHKRSGAGWNIEVMGEHRSGFDLILLDTFASMKMLDENSNTEMQIVMNNLRALAEATGAAICFAHHHDKQFARLRGASVILASSDVHLELKGIKEWREGNAQHIRNGISLKKFRGMKIDPFEYVMEVTEDTARMTYLGDTTPSDSVKPTDEEPDGIKYARAEGAWKAMLLATEPDTWLKTTSMLTHVGTLGRVNSRTLYKWMKKFREHMVGHGWVHVDHAAMRVTVKGREAAFKLGE